MTDVDTVDGSEILHQPGMYTKILVYKWYMVSTTVPSTWRVYRISEPSTVWHSLGNPPNSWYGKLSHYIKGFITQVVGLGISEPSTPFTGTNPKPPHGSSLLRRCKPRWGWTTFARCDGSCWVSEKPWRWPSDAWRWGTARGGWFFSETGERGFWGIGRCVCFFVGVESY